MKNDPHSLNSPDPAPAAGDETPSPDNLPVINIDDDPDNANWLRILARRREEEQQRKQQQPSPQQ